MPHWQSEPDAWRALCDDLSIGFIDPRGQPDAVLGALGRTDVLITEAMHGAIVADALRIPWVPVRTREGINSFKWDDWCGSLSLEYQPHQLPTIHPATKRGVIASARRRAKLSLASAALSRVARRARPVLSGDSVLSDRIDRLEDRLEQLRRRELRG